MAQNDVMVFVALLTLLLTETFGNKEKLKSQVKKTE